MHLNAGSLALTASRGGAGPGALFAAGEKGVWFDPSDLSTLTQGVGVPVTAVEQPVGLMLDKSQGLALGAELIVNGAFNSDVSSWTQLTGTTAWVGNAMQVTASGAFGRGEQSVATTVGAVYRVSATVFVAAGSTGNLRATQGSSPFGTDGDAGNITSTTPVSVSFYFVASQTSTLIQCAAAANGNVATFDNVSCRQVLGNHAYQATSTSRPVLRARYNLLTYSEDATQWTQAVNGATVTADAAAAPDGNTTADRVNLGTADYRYNTTSAQLPPNTYTASVWAKSFSGSNVQLALRCNASLTGANQASSLTTVGATWQRITLTLVLAATDFVVFGPDQRNGVGSGIGVAADVLLWGMQIIPGANAGTYQRIAAATVYDTAGFVPYLDADGVDDCMQTANIDMTGTSKLSLFAGMMKGSDAATQMLAELSADSNVNPGFYMSTPVSAAPTFSWHANGTAPANVNTGSSYPAPINAVLTGLMEISTPREMMRVNGVLIADANTTLGSGNLGNLPLYLFSRAGGATFPLKGRCYGLILRGATSTAAEIALAEAWCNARAGAY